MGTFWSALTALGWMLQHPPHQAYAYFTIKVSSPHHMYFEQERMAVLACPRLHFHIWLRVIIDYFRSSSPSKGLWKVEKPRK